MVKKFDHRRIEAAWRDIWLKKHIFWPADMFNVKNKFYNLWMFPYPSAEGLHAGHAFSSTGSDVYGRFKRMNDLSVFEPIGYDSFGIHSENFSLKIGEHPKEMLGRTTKNYEKQLKSLGHAYDWTRTVTTSDVSYYRWTQWLFIQIFKTGLAYRKESLVNWCPSCKTVLADEQVIDGKCERCGSTVKNRSLEQWFFRITEYADRLLANLGKIDWPEKIKIAQRRWIGKKEGITIKYPILNSKFEIRNSKFSHLACWTSRPDTNFGATFIVLAPEHPFAAWLLSLKLKAQSPKLEEIRKYIERTKSISKEQRVEQGREKTGVFTGYYAINHLSGFEMPIYISDFVLTDVGTGAVVGVPGHDKRDFEFAEEFGLKVKRVVVGSDKDESEINRIEQVQEENGTMINSGFLDGLDINEATLKMMDYLSEKGWGDRSTTYHLRDWLISRQRYWGPPIPMIFCKKCAKAKKSYFTKTDLGKLIRKDQSDWNHFGWYPQAEEKLPVELPYLKDYKPTGGGRGPLADHPEFYKTKCPECGGQAERETDVSDTFLDSSWYFLRYPSARSARSGQVPFDPEITKKWLPVDLYFGGAEHAVLHLMYSRFVTMILNDLGYLSFDEPFPRFFAHGLMIKNGAKMSKSRGNVVNPDEYVEKFGSDTLRLYLMFMGPMDGYPDFRDTGIEGTRRFIDRVWKLYTNNYKKLDEKDRKNVYNKMHQTSKKVTEDIQEFKYNTAIASIMEFINLISEKGSDKEVLKVLTLLLAPFAPHITEEIWQRFGFSGFGSRLSDSSQP